ncbi:GNAT family N-acetyltransferase [Kribbella kalugense]|uniref:GNAT family N-acetyltransferase n=1 Tax=Kribbella kalugense TaxID=2512221 RepID=UPI0034E29CAF
MFHGAGAADIVGAFDGNSLVSSATIVTARDTANLWSVATSQNERGRGATSAVIAAALVHAVGAGCSRAASAPPTNSSPGTTASDSPKSEANAARSSAGPLSRISKGPDLLVAFFGSGPGSEPNMES